MNTVTLYTRTGCHLCGQAKTDLEALQSIIPHKLVEIDIESDQALVSKFALEIPVVEIGPYRLKAPFTRKDLEITLRAAADRETHIERVEEQPAGSRDMVTSSDRFSYWLSRHYLLLFNLFLFMYIGIPFLAPVFKEAGWNTPAAVIYKVYSLSCHQWGFRSFFLFGEQAYYPHAEAGIPDVITFESATGITDQSDPSRTQAREFVGNPVMGYKIALCERDVAIWGSLLLFGLVFAVSGRRIPKVNWLLLMIIGIVPIGLDGFSQLLSQIPVPYDLLQTILPYRESTPLLRGLTGAIFGMAMGWLLFPAVEETMADSRRFLAKKFTASK